MRIEIEGKNLTDNIETTSYYFESSDLFNVTVKMTLKNNSQILITLPKSPSDRDQVVRNIIKLAGTIKKAPFQPEIAKCENQ